MKENVLNDLALEIFEMVDSSDQSDLTEQMMKAMITIRDIYLEVQKREKELRIMSKQKDYLNLHNQIEPINQSIECFSSSIKESTYLKEIISYLQTIDAAAKKCAEEQMNGDDDNDNEQGMKFRYSEAIFSCLDNEELIGYLKEAFADEMIDSVTYNSLNFNVIETEDCEIDYNSPVNLLAVRTSHLIYKLKTFKNYPFILSEYADVLNQLKLNVVDLLKEFKCASILLPHLLTMLNVLLREKLKECEWERLLKDYSDYPFVTPLEVTQEEFGIAINILFTNNWYRTYRKSAESKTIDQSIALKKLKKNLLNEFFSKDQLVEIELRVPVILDAIDNCHGLNHFSYLEVFQVDSWWKCDLPSHIEPGTTIPKEVLKLEKSLHYPTNIPSRVLYQVWSEECPMKMEDKLSILCPRRRTMQGNMILDMINVNLLRNAILLVIWNVKDIDELVESVILAADDIYHAEEKELQAEWEEAEENMEKSEADFEQISSETAENRQYLIDKYTELADEKTRNKGYGKDYKIHNLNTIKMYCYMYAVNNLKESDFMAFLDNAKIQEHDVDYTPCYEYHPFDFQMIFISRDHTLLADTHNITLTLNAPEGINGFLKSDSIQFSGSAIITKGVAISTGYLLVLPLAPFKWNVNIMIDEETIEMKKDEIALVYYSNDINKLGYYKKRKWNEEQKQNNVIIIMEMYFLLCLLKCMVNIRDCYGLKYLIPLSQDIIITFLQKENKQSTEYRPSHVYTTTYSPYSYGIFASTNYTYYSNNCVECIEIQCVEDIVPATIVLTDQSIIDATKTYWTVEDFLDVGSDLGEIASNDPISAEDVQQFRKRFDEYKILEQRNELMKSNEIECREKLEMKIQGYFSPFLYFFPTTGDVLCSNTNECLLNDVIVVMYDGKTAFLGLPKNNTYYLPDSIEGLHGNQISLHYLLTSQDVNLELISNDCIITKNKNSFIIVMKDNRPGGKRVKLTALVYRALDYEKLISEEIMICYERKSIRNVIKTSVPCSFQNSFDKISGDKYTLFPKSSPVRVAITVNGKVNYYNCASGSTTILTNPCIQVSFVSVNLPMNVSYSDSFSWNEKGLEDLEIKHISHNLVELPILTSDNSLSTIQKLQSKHISEFLSVFSSLPITIFSAQMSDRNMIVSILNGCLNERILPTIRKAAESILELVPSENIMLDWNDEIIVPRKPDISHNDDKDLKIMSSKVCVTFMNKMNMDNLFELIFSRHTIDKFVEPSSVNNSISDKALPSNTPKIADRVVQAIVSVSVKIIEMLKRMDCMTRKTYSKINIIIDTNCSLRKHKLRMRTIISSILITVIRDLGISFNMYVCCGKFKGVHIPVMDRSLYEIISFLFDIEEIVRMPSAPLDLLSINSRFNEKDPVVIISDGFSEQLMSPDNEKIRNIIGRYSLLYLLCIKGKNEEALSMANQWLLEKALGANFHNNIIMIDSIKDILNPLNFRFMDIFFSSQRIEMNKIMNISPSAHVAQDLKDDLKVSFRVNKAMISFSTITSSKPSRKIDILDENLCIHPKPVNDDTVLNKLNEVIQGQNLFEAMSISAFAPDMSTESVASISGTLINLEKYIKFMVNKKGNGKIFQKVDNERKVGNAASIVIDCSSIAFSETNRVHSLLTIFSVIRNLSNMQLPCVDLWVASSKIICIATGMPSVDLWENNIVGILYESLLSPCQNTCLPDCIRYASCTCNARSFQSVMIVLTNGVLCNESRYEIKSIVSGIEMTYFGIGIGLYLCGFEDLFPTMIWNSNPLQPSETLSNLSTALTSENLNATPEQPLDDIIMNGSFDKTYVDIINYISSTESDFSTTLNYDRFVDEEKKSYKKYTILFIVLYLCREEKDDTGNIIDESITEEILRNGNVRSGKRCSPILTLGNKIIDGKLIGKGFNIHYAFDYNSAIKELMSGKYRMTFIICSPGDGKMAKNYDEDANQNVDQFVSCIHEFNTRGGGVFWFLENYPFTYEADLYFKTFYGFEAAVDKDKTIEGGKVMKRVESQTPKAGEFITMEGKAMDLSNMLSLDYGIIQIYEGKTLCKLNEGEFEKSGFRVFARESKGTVSILVKDKKKEESEGRMIIDTAASKLFLEYSEDGTGRWISNAAIWLCNTEEFEEQQSRVPSLSTGIKMDGSILAVERKTERRILGEHLSIL